ncbi:hypothetical protein [Mycobacterium sp.]|uniref:hypothetical protein n=1 Tax=Mycobacterium sp. TaxID=1785 RepID=UPI0033414F3A
MTAPPTGGGAEAETGAAVAGGPAAGITGGGPEAAPVVEASCDGGGEDTGGGSSGAPPPPPVPSPAERPREKSFGVAGGAAEVGGAVRPPAGPLKPGLSGGIEDVPVGIPVDGVPVDGKLSPLVGPPVIGNDGPEVEVVGA